jgi:AhpD family alkylhydroperoxidase
MPQPEHISKLGVPDPATLDDDLQVIWQKCVDKLGFVPNVFSAYSLKPRRLRNFMAMYNEIMLSDSGLSKLEREMVAVVVSSANRCYYCLVAHGAAVREAGLDEQDIFDLSETVAFFNLSNRMASATDMMPNREYHRAART